MSHHVILFNMPGTNFMTIKKTSSTLALSVRGVYGSMDSGQLFMLSDGSMLVYISPTTRMVRAKGCQIVLHNASTLGHACPNPFLHRCCLTC